MMKNAQRSRNAFTPPPCGACQAGCVSYGQAMGGWGKLSLSSTAFYLDGLPVPFVSAENVCLDGLFARGGVAYSCFGRLLFVKMH